MTQETTRIWVLTEGDANRRKFYCGLFSSPELAKERALETWPPYGEVYYMFVKEIFERGAWKLEYNIRPISGLYSVTFWIHEADVDRFAVK